MAKGWTFDRHINIGGLVALVVQTIFVGIWIGNINSRMAEMESKLREAKSHVERIVKMETTLDHLKDGMTEVKGMLRGQQAMRLGAGSPVAALPPPAPLQPVSSPASDAPKAVRIPAADAPARVQAPARKHMPRSWAVRSDDPWPLLPFWRPTR